MASAQVVAIINLPGDEASDRFWQSMESMAVCFFVLVAFVLYQFGSDAIVFRCSVLSQDWSRWILAQPEREAQLKKAAKDEALAERARKREERRVARCQQAEEDEERFAALMPPRSKLPFELSFDEKCQRFGAKMAGRPTYAQINDMLDLGGTGKGKSKASEVAAEDSETKPAKAATKGDQTDDATSKDDSSKTESDEQAPDAANLATTTTTTSKDNAAPSESTDSFTFLTPSDLSRDLTTYYQQIALQQLEKQPQKKSSGPQPSLWEYRSCKSKHADIDQKYEYYILCQNDSRGNFIQPPKPCECGYQNEQQVIQQQFLIIQGELKAMFISLNQKLAPHKEESGHYDHLTMQNIIRNVPGGLEWADEVKQIVEKAYLWASQDAQDGMPHPHGTKKLRVEQVIALGLVSVEMRTLEDFLAFAAEYCDQMTNCRTQSSYYTAYEMVVKAAGFFSSWPANPGPKSQKQLECEVYAQYGVFAHHHFRALPPIWETEYGPHFVGGPAYYAQCAPPASSLDHAPQYQAPYAPAVYPDTASAAESMRDRGMASMFGTQPGRSPDASIAPTMPQPLGPVVDPVPSNPPASNGDSAAPTTDNSAPTPAAASQPAAPAVGPGVSGPQDSNGDGAAPTSSTGAPISTAPSPPSAAVDSDGPSNPLAPDSATTTPSQPSVAPQPMELPDGKILIQLDNDQAREIIASWMAWINFRIQQSSLTGLRLDKAAWDALIEVDHGVLFLIDSIRRYADKVLAWGNPEGRLNRERFSRDSLEGLGLTTGQSKHIRDLFWTIKSDNDHIAGDTARAVNDLYSTIQKAMKKA